jgi:hypothetical protein
VVNAEKSVKKEKFFQFAPIFYHSETYHIAMCYRALHMLHKFESCVGS